MADITITPGNVVTAGAIVESGTAGAAITAGQVVYRDAATRKYLLADADGVAAAKAPRGIALNGGALNQPISVALSGPVTIGGALSPGAAYYASSNPGGIAPFADVGTGERAVLLGVATSATVLRISIIDTGATL